MIARLNFALDLVSGRVAAITLPAEQPIDAPPENANALIEAIARRFELDEVSAGTRRTLLEQLAAPAEGGMASTGKKGSAGRARARIAGIPAALIAGVRLFAANYRINAMNLSRRIFLKRGALALASVGAIPAWGPAFLRQTVRANESVRRGKVLICLFQRGAADGLSMVVPHGDAHYYEHRSEIALSRPAQAAGDAACLDLDGFFGLHPRLASFLPIYRAGHLAVIHACGSPSVSRSHFDAQDFMESGVAGDKAVQAGWLSRALRACPEDRARQVTPFRAISMTATVPRSLQGEIDPLAIPDLRSFGLGAGKLGHIGLSQGTAAGFESMYDAAVHDVLRGTSQESFEALSLLKGVDPAKYQPANGATYPEGAFGRSLRQIAQLVKADLGVEVAFAESDGWDTHANQGAVNGALAARLHEFSRSIAALYQDLGDRMEDVVILTMSEFGRAARQNGNKGTDHGHGTCFFALGGKVAGGKVLGAWPGLSPEQLFEARDLAVTTDYRDIFGEIAARHLGVPRLEEVFPGYGGDSGRWRGVLRA